MEMVHGFHSSLSSSWFFAPRERDILFIMAHGRPAHGLSGLSILFMLIVSPCKQRRLPTCCRPNGRWYLPRQNSRVETLHPNVMVFGGSAFAGCIVYEVHKWD